LATKISITKKLEAELRELAQMANAGRQPEAIRAVVRLIDAAHSSKASGSGDWVLAGTLIATITDHRPVVLPPNGPIGNMAFARLNKCLHQYQVTKEQAEALGIWLAGPGMKAAPGEITIDRIIKNLGDWITRAVANKPSWERPEW
jgi:hypothetical protein